MTPASDTLRISGIGAQVTLSLGGPRKAELDERLRAAWSRCLRPCDGPEGEPLSIRLADEEGGIMPVARGDRDLHSANLELIMMATTQAVTASLIRAQAGRLLMFHAGAVCSPDTGRGLVFVAEGGTGKTTLSRILGRRFGYLSDETVGIDTSHRILPYPKPLSVRRTGGGAKHEVPPDELDLLAASDHPDVARVIILDRDDDHPKVPTVTELDLFEAITALTPQTSSLFALDAGLHRCAELIEATGPVLRVRYTEADSLLGLADELIGSGR